MSDEEYRFGWLNDVEPQVGEGWTKPMLEASQLANDLRRQASETTLAMLPTGIWNAKPVVTGGLAVPLPPLEGCEVCAAAGRDHEWTAVRPSHPESPCMALKLCAECSQAQRVADVVPQGRWPLLAALRPSLPWVGITLAFSALMALSFL